MSVLLIRIINKKKFEKMYCETLKSYEGFELNNASHRYDKGLVTCIQAILCIYLILHTIYRYTYI